ncbi:MAG: hypothetical protein HQ519_18865 [Planctomycetes bacterium]|nr:hypothetical protein [Planctomycetota bacterium]
MKKPTANGASTLSASPGSIGRVSIGALNAMQTADASAVMAPALKQVRNRDVR